MNKKLIIINMVTLVAFILVVGAGIYQANANKDTFGKVQQEEKSIDNEVVEIEEDDKALIEDDKVLEIKPVEFVKKDNVGALVLRNKELFVLDDEDEYEVKEIEEYEEDFEGESSEYSNDNIVPSSGRGTKTYETHLDKEEKDLGEDSEIDSSNGSSKDSDEDLEKDSSNGSGKDSDKDSEKDSSDDSGKDSDKDSDKDSIDGSGKGSNDDSDKVPNTDEA